MTSSTAPSPATPTAPKHQWKFVRLGGLDQVVLEIADDLLCLDQLDQKLWVALSCPVQGVELDEKTLALLDADGDGRIRVPELLAGLKWLAPRLKDPAEILKRRAPFTTGLITEKTPEGRALLAAAKNLRAEIPPAATETRSHESGTLNPGGEATALTVDTTTEAKKIFAEKPFNGDGVIPADSADEPAVKKLIADIIATQGSVTDLGGKPGVNQEKIDAFNKDIAAYLAWHATSTPQILCLGESTPAAYAALKTVRAKIDDYFARCRLAAFDPRAVASLNGPETDYAAILKTDLRAAGNETAAFPIAQVSHDKPLPLLTGVNPAWAAALADFQKTVVAPLHTPAKATLTADEWHAITEKFAPYETWIAAKAGAPVEPLGAARIKEISAAKKEQTALAELIAKDKALEAEVGAIGDLDRLVRYHRDMGDLLRSFVNFTDFYSPEYISIFQAGVLYFDTRSCELCIRVNDPAAHSVLAAYSRACIAYCDLKRPGGKTMKIAACFTQGDSDFLIAGRNGLFYDRHGDDWDATITKVIENPISLREAFWSPYKKFVRMIEEQLSKRASAADSSAMDKLSSTATNVANADQTAAAPAAAGAAAAPAAPKKIDVGTVAAMGVAFGAIGGAFMALVGFVSGVKPWFYPLLLLAVILIISGPSVFIAWIKLRQRTLGPILDASGWAINGRIKINVPLGTSLTARAILPDGSQRTIADPYEDKAAKRRVRWIIFAIVVLVLAGAAAGLWWDYDHNEAHTWLWQRF